jgi:hypothetical protein
LPFWNTSNMRPSPLPTGSSQYGTLSACALLLVMRNSSAPAPEVSAYMARASGLRTGCSPVWRAAKLAPAATTKAVAKAMVRTVLDMRDPGQVERCPLFGGHPDLPEL